MNEDPLARIERPCVLQTVPGSDGRNGYGGGADIVQPLRYGRKARFIERHEFGVRAQTGHCPHNAVAHAETGRIGTDCVDNPSHFGAQDDG